MIGPSWTSIPIDSLVVGLEWGRIPERKIEQLTMEVCAHGMLPIHVRKLPRTGWFWFLKRQRYLILDGKVRAEVASRLGLKMIPAKVFPHASDRTVKVAKPMARGGSHTPRLTQLDQL